MRSYLKNQLHIGDDWSLTEALAESFDPTKLQPSPPLEGTDYLPSPICLPESPRTYVQVIQNLKRLQTQDKKEAADLEQKRVKFCF